MELSRRGNNFVLTFPNGVVMKFQRLQESDRSGLSAEVTITYTPLTHPHLHRSTINLSAARTRTSIVKLLKERIPDLDWYALIEAAFVTVMDAYRVGEPVHNLRDVVPSESLPYRIEPFILTRAPSLIYGPGGLGKSSLALYMAMLIQSGATTRGLFEDIEPCSVLYLDWEESAQDTHKRLALMVKGHDFMDGIPPIIYRRMNRSLPADVDAVLDVITDHNIGHVVIDSAGPACGGRPEDADATLAFFEALRSLETSALILAHEAKNGNGKTPFGSVYWWNMSRTVWQMEQERELGSPHIDIAMHHRKANAERLRKPVIYRVIHEPESIRFERNEIRAGSALSKGLPIPEQIRTLLGSGLGMMTARAIAEHIERPLSSVESELSRMKSDGQILNPARGYWGLVSNRIQ